MTDLRARVVAHRGGFVLDVDVLAASSGTLAVLGPNGAGKSTLLDVVVGRLRADAGTVRTGERVLSAPADRIHVPTEQRRIGLLGQSPTLFPHLTALENVTFGPRAARTPSRQASADARALLDAVGLAGYEGRRPGALSGGQQQRVALARALAAHPDVLLLDEPFSALDVTTAADIRSLVTERLAATETTAVIVTHDVVDALSLADRCVILDDGRIVDGGEIDRVLARPRSAFVAALAGMNLVAGVAEADGVVRAAGWPVFRGRIVEAVAEGRPAFAAFPPSAVRLRPAGGDNAAGEFVVRSTVTALERAPGGVRVRLGHERLFADLSPAESAALGLRPGADVDVAVAAQAVAIYSGDDPRPERAADRGPGRE